MKIGFIDFSHEERNKILSTLNLLKERTALDELGIGAVRDAFADILFPGISTLQTRAKYLVLIPYLFQSARLLAEKDKIRSGRELQQWINEAEDRLVATLTNNSPTEVGIIGSNAYHNKRTVKIKPSAIYWTALKTFGIFREENMYLHAACKLVYQAARKRAETTNQTSDYIYDDPTAKDQGSTLFLPIGPDYNYEKDATINLTKKEAQFLSECILRSPLSSGSLLAFFIKNKMICNDINSVPIELLPDKLRIDFCLAKDFSRFIYGAHIRYNIIYSGYKDEDLVNRFNTWRNSFHAETFELDPILNRVPCPKDLATFCLDFLDCIRTNNIKNADDLIVSREKDVKRDRSKLRKPSEYRYDPNHPVHLYKLEYRFNRASVIIRDILSGLGV